MCIRDRVKTSLCYNTNLRTVAFQCIVFGNGTNTRVNNTELPIINCICVSVCDVNITVGKSATCLFALNRNSNNQDHTSMIKFQFFPIKLHTMTFYYIVQHLCLLLTPPHTHTHNQLQNSRLKSLEKINNSNSPDSS